MYSIIQKHKRLAATIIAIASISFLFWMFSVSDIKQMFGLKRCVAQVNGSCITLREFRYELLKYSNLLENEELRDVIRRQVLYSLLSREALYQKALGMGLVASDREVADYIKGDPNFQRNGRFDFNLYKEVIERVGLTPAEYETYIKKALTAQKLTSFVSKGVYLTDKEREFLRRMLYTRFEGKLYLLSSDSLSLSYEPSEEDMERFYRENRDKFKVPPKKVILLWKTKSKEEAHSIYSSLKRGEVPEGWTQAENAGDLPDKVLESLRGLSGTGDYTIAKFADTYYVAYLKEVKPGHFRPFPEVKEEVRSMMLAQKKERLLEEKAMELGEALRNGDKVDVKPLEFDSSGLEEFVALFNIGEKEGIKLVFSDERVFGPYRTSRGFAVIYIESRKLELPAKEKQDAEELRRAKEEAIVDLFVRKVVEDSDVKINEEFLEGGLK